MAEDIVSKPDSITGRIARIGRYTDPVVRKLRNSNEVSVETAIHFTLENDPTIYTAYISRFSTREKAVSLALAQVGDEVSFFMINQAEAADFVNLSVPTGPSKTAPD